MVRFLKYSVAILLLIAILGVLAFIFLPLNSYAEDWLSQKLQSQGIPIIELKLESISLTHAEFSNVKLDTGETLIIPTVRVAYTKDNLLQKRLDEIELSGIDYTHILAQTAEEPKDEPLTLPSLEMIRQLPIEHITISQSKLSLKGDGFTAQLPFEAEIDRDSETPVIIKGKSATATLTNKGSATVKDWTVNLGAAGEIWQVALDADYTDTSTPMAGQLQEEASPPPSLDITSYLPIGHIKVIQSNVNFKGDGLAARIPFEAEIHRDSETPVIIKGESATANITNQGSVNVKKWAMNFSGAEKIWQLAFDVDYTDTSAPTAEEPKDKALTLPSVNIIRQFPIEHLKITQSNASFKGGGLTAQLAFEAEINRASKTPVMIKGKTASATLKNLGSFNLKNWAVNLGAAQMIWQVALETESLHATLAPKSKSKKSAQNTAPVKLILPTVKGANLTSLNFPNIKLDYKEPKTSVTSTLSAILAANKKSLKLKSKRPTAVNLTEATLKAPSWNATLVWPMRVVKVRDIVANKLAIELKESRKSSSNSGYPMPSLLSNLPIGKLTSKGSRLTGSFKNGSYSSNFSLAGTISPTPSLRIDASKTTISIDNQRYELKGLAANAKAVKGYWNLSSRIKTLQSPTLEGAKWLPLALGFNGSIKRNRIDMKVDVTHKEFEVKTGVALNGTKTELLSPLITVAGGEISAGIINISTSPMTANLNFNNISLEELLQLMLEDNQSVKATGRVSGIIPISYKPDEFRIGDGVLKSTTSGLLSIGEQHLGMLPKTVEEVNNISELLQHFEYKMLNISTEEKDGKLGITAALEGRNPEVYEGAEVHLNINLRGDVLETISSALGVIDLPERYLKGTANAR